MKHEKYLLRTKYFRRFRFAVRPARRLVRSNAKIASSVKVMPSYDTHILAYLEFENIHVLHDQLYTYYHSYFIICLLERTGFISPRYRCPVEESEIIMGPTVGPSGLVRSGRFGDTVEETRDGQQRADGLRGADEGLGQRYCSQVLPRRQLPRRK